MNVVATTPRYSASSKPSATRTARRCTTRHDGARRLGLARTRTRRTARVGSGPTYDGRTLGDPSGTGPTCRPRSKCETPRGRGTSSRVRFRGLASRSVKNGVPPA